MTMQGLSDAEIDRYQELAHVGASWAATALAHRVATERQSPEPGHKHSQVGYMVRLDRAVSESSKIVYCTVGILLRMLVCPTHDEDDDIPLSKLTHVVVDEGKFVGGVPLPLLPLC